MNSNKSFIIGHPGPEPESQTGSDHLGRDVPSPFNIPGGCRFHTRCPLAGKDCQTAEPEFVEVSNGHYVACHRV